MGRLGRLNGLVLNTDNLEKRYGGTTVLQPLTFSVGSGEIVGVLGPNGSGKTTLLHMVAGLIEPTKGAVEIDGGSPKSPLVRRRIGVAPDDLALPLVMTGWEFMLLHEEVRCQDRSELSETLLDLFGLLPDMGRPLQEYSHGMKRKLQFVVALGQLPSLVLLDEPYRGLDPEASGVLVEALKSIKKTTATLIATHDLEQASKLCDRVLIIHKGAVVANGTPALIVEGQGSSNLQEAFLAITGLDNRLRTARSLIDASIG